MFFNCFLVVEDLVFPTPESKKNHTSMDCEDFEDIDANHNGLSTCTLETIRGTTTLRATPRGLFICQIPPRTMTSVGQLPPMIFNPIFSAVRFRVRVRLTVAK